MAIYKYPDPRHFAFLLAGLFLVLFSIRPLDPTDFFTYLPIFSGSLVLALFGIQIACYHLLWPILIVTGFMTTVSGIALIPSAPFVFIPNVMFNWDECKEFFDDKKHNSSDYCNLATAIIENTLACKDRNLFHGKYFVPFLTTPAIYCIFVLFKKTHSLIKKSEKRLPVTEEEASEPYWLAMIGFVALLILVFAFATRVVASSLWPSSFTLFEYVEVCLTCFLMGICSVLLFYGYVDQVVTSLILYFFFKAITNFVQGTISMIAAFRDQKDLWATCHNYLKAMIETSSEDTFTRFFSLNLTGQTNNTDLAASIVANSCIEAFRLLDPINLFHPLGAALLFIWSISYLLAIIHKPIWKTTKKIIQSGI